MFFKMHQAEKKGLDPPVFRTTIYLSMFESHWSLIFDEKHLHNLGLQNILAYSVLSFLLCLAILIYSYKEKLRKYTFHNQVKLCDAVHSSPFS